LSPVQTKYTWRGNFGLWVNDIFFTGDDPAIDQLLADLQEEFVIKVENELSDYVGCHITMSPDKKKIWLSQPDLIYKLERKFGATVKNMRV